MDWITEHVAIGNFADAQDLDLFQQEGIQSVLGLINTLGGKDPSSLGLRRIVVVPLTDGPGNDPRLFCRAVAVLEELVQEAAPVLVHCHAGRSRAPVVVAGYLMKALGITSEEAVARVGKKREICVTPVLLDLLEG